MTKTIFWLSKKIRLWAQLAYSTVLDGKKEEKKKKKNKKNKKKNKKHIVWGSVGRYVSEK
jgi:hypothetical protein